MNTDPKPTPKYDEIKLEDFDFLKKVINTNDSWMVPIRWKSNLVGVLGAFWRINLHLISTTTTWTTSGEEILEEMTLNLGALIVPVELGTGPISYYREVTIPSGVVPEGIYRLFLTLLYFDEQGKLTNTIGSYETGEIQFVRGVSSDEKSEIELTLTTKEGQKVTPSYLAKTISPLLIAIADIQVIIDDIQLRSHREVVIKAITQYSPISVSLNGAAESVNTIQDMIVPWRRNHVETMAHLEEQEKLTEIESKKAEVLERRANSAKNRAEAAKFYAEEAKQREDVERMKLENQKLRLELNFAKIQLILNILVQIAPSMSETQRIDYIMRLLPEIDVLISSDIDIAASKIAKFQKI